MIYLIENITIYNIELIKLKTEYALTLDASHHCKSKCMVLA